MLRKSEKRIETASRVDEQAVLDDIRYFEARLKALGEPCSARDAATAQVYRLLLRQRRQLLAAVRDGVPEKWPEYGANG